MGAQRQTAAGPEFTGEMLAAGQSAATKVLVDAEGDGRDLESAVEKIFVGRYRVMGEAGRGGMGRVLRAYDPKLGREVALKEIEPSLTSIAARGRLVAEARAMARLVHPNVVGVYDVEEGDGHGLWLVMEYVEGVDLRAWLQAERRSAVAICRQFHAAGLGLAAAHREGVLHRDFKPANVLVGQAGTTKVADFGLARAMGSREVLAGGAQSGPWHSAAPVLIRCPVEDGWEVSVGEAEAAQVDGLTKPGMVLGTPRYMSPEQHVGRPLDTTADQYAFCVALWEALCGAPPFSGPRLIEDKRRGPPPWPGSGHPARLIKAIRRGLDPDPWLRWPSMNALLAELLPDRRRAAGRRWVAGLGLGLMATTSVPLYMWNQSRAERCSGGAAQWEGVWNDARAQRVEAAFAATRLPYAERAWARTAAELEEYRQDWLAKHREACEATAVRGEQSVAVMDLKMGCLGRAMIEVAAVVDVLEGADAKLVEKAEDVVAGLPLLSRCQDENVLTAELDPPRVAEADGVAAVRRRLAESKAEEDAGHYERCRAALAEAKEALTGLSYEPVKLEVALREARTLELGGEYGEADARARQALRQAVAGHEVEQMRTAMAELMAVVGNRRLRFAEALQYREVLEGLGRHDPGQLDTVVSAVGQIRYREGRYAEAETYLRDSLRLREVVYGRDSIPVRTTRGALASVLSASGRLADAARELQSVFHESERALGRQHPRTISIMSNLGVVLTDNGKYGEAEALLRSGLVLAIQVYGAEHREVAAFHNNLGNVLKEQGNYPEAEAQLRCALAIYERSLGAEHPIVGRGYNNLAGILAGQGRFDEAETHMRRSLEILEGSLAADHPSLASVHQSLGALLAMNRRLTEAESEVRTALALQQKSLQQSNPSVAETHNVLGGILSMQQKHDSAVQEFSVALQAFEASLPADHPSVGNVHANMAESLLEIGHSADAVRHAERAWARLNTDGIPANDQAFAAFTLARALWANHADRGARRRAFALAGQALTSYLASGFASDPDVSEVRQWLREHRR